MDPLERAGLLELLGEQLSEDLPGLATDALVRGLDSPALRELAGLRARDSSEGHKLLLDALEQLELSVTLDLQDALWRLIRDVAQGISDGRVDPYEGASWIWRHAYHRVVAEGDLRVFVGLASEIEDHPELRSTLSGDIVEASREILAREEPRVWIKLQARPGGPVWIPRTMEPFDLRDLPVQPRLRDELLAWQTNHDTLFATTSGSGGFLSAEEADTFVARGRELVAELQSSLGPRWWVEYLPEPTRPPGLRLRRNN